MLHDGRSYDPIQGHDQGHRRLKVVKMDNFKVSPPPICM